jgi:hypothetical protein
MVEYSDPIPTRASKVAVSTFAEQLAINLEFKAGDPLDPLVSQLSGKITYRNPIGAEKPESIRIEPTGEFEIFLPSVTSLGRDRFTIAHELGHLFLHFPLVQNSRPESGMKATRWVDETNQDLQRCEWEPIGLPLHLLCHRETFERHAVSMAAYRRSHRSLE